MATMFTRTIATYKASAYHIAWEDDKPIGEVFAETTYPAVSDNKGVARAALKEAGFDIPRGTEIRVTKVDEELYGLTLEEFMRYAHKLER